jgi:hypothetical protein
MVGAHGILIAAHNVFIVMHHYARVDRSVGSLETVDSVTGVLQSFVDSLEQQSNLRIHAASFSWANTKKLGIKPPVDAALCQEIGVFDIAMAMVLAVLVIEAASVESLLWYRSEQVSWILEQIPQCRRGVCGTRETAADTDKSYWFWGCHAGGSGKLGNLSFGLKDNIEQSIIEKLVRIAT